MASIFDQYDTPTKKQQNPNPLPTAMTSSGYISLQLDDSTPMFTKQKMNFSPSDSITHLTVSDDVLVVAMANGRLFRMNLKQPNKNEEIHFSKYIQPGSKLHEIYLDPKGNHLLMSFIPRIKNDSCTELLYFHKKINKFKSIGKSKTYEITAVGWNYENVLEDSTGPILLGNSVGHIIETEISVDNDKMFQTSIEQYWKQVFDIGKGTETPITGLEFHRIKNTNKYFIFVTTPKRLYHFIGHTNLNDKPFLQSIFNSYLNVKETSFQEISSSLNYSKLQFFYDRNKSPKSFGWLTELGIIYGQLDPMSQENSNSFSTHKKTVLETSVGQKSPTAFVITEFHALVMYEEQIKIYSLLNQELIDEDIYTADKGRLVNIVKDSATDIIWAATNKFIFRYKVTREDRNVWKIYCDQNEFDLAKMYCNNNMAYIDCINIKQAEFLFAKGQFEESASIYAKTLSSFEMICLKFLEKNKIEALKIYLIKRLESLADDDKTLISMLVVWLVELFLSQLGALRKLGEDDTEQYHQIQSDFEVFFLQPKVKKCMSHLKRTMYGLMSSHGDKENLLKFCTLYEDHENVIAYNIQRKNYLQALDNVQQRPELFYEFGPILLQEVPKYTVNALISLGRKMNPSRLLPSMLACDSDTEHISEIIRYLEFMIQNFNVREQAIHNYLLTLYVEHRSESLMRYLNQQGNDLHSINFDVNFALRLCRQKELSKPCVKLSALLGLWESAVELAITFDLQLAKNIANMLEEDDDLRKKLWIKIAEHVISKNQNMEQAMSFLNECELLKIEDILPFFSEVNSIDHFRDAICNSLEEYNNQIDDLKQEMDDAIHSAEIVRNEIISFRNRNTIVKVNDSCDLCDIVLLLRPFYLFPCGHKFHSDCLQNEVIPTLGPARRNKLAELQRQLNTLSKSDVNSISSSGLPMRERITNDIDDILASECLYCGEHMIQCIDKPFIEDDDWDRVMKEW